MKKRSKGNKKMDNKLTANRVNFQGAFVIKRISPEVKAELLESFPAKKIFFDKFRKDEDILLVTRVSLDKKAADFIKTKRLKFKYYPQLTTKSGFKESEPLEAARILRTQKDTVITTLKGMFAKLQPVIKKNKSRKKR